ncbi:Os02g0312300 [Oryza sativa Japonica Group]|nr:Os02g0312300 [Oryza sativa Japonica Group]
MCSSAAAGARAAEFAGARMVALRRLPASVVGGASAFQGAGDSGLRPLLSPAVAEPPPLPPLLSAPSPGERKGRVLVPAPPLPHSFPSPRFLLSCSSAHPQHAPLCAGGLVEGGCSIVWFVSRSLENLAGLMEDTDVFVALSQLSVPLQAAQASFIFGAPPFFWLSVSRPD